MFETRLARVVAVFGGVLCVLAVRAFALQAVQRDKILDEQTSRIRGRIVLSPRRGDVLWADGTPAATDAPGVSVLVDPVAFEARRLRCGECGATTRRRNVPKACLECGTAKSFETLAPPDAAALAAALRMTEEEFGRRLGRAIDEHRKFPWLGVHVLADDAGRDAALEVSRRADEFPGVTVRAFRDRVVDPVAAPVVGRTRKAFREERLRLTDPSRELEGLRVYSSAEVYAMRFGATGLERTFDGRLRGDVGEARRLPPKNGRPQQPEVKRPVEDGVPLKTTLRRSVQAAADEIVDDAPGAAAAVVLDVASGAVVAVASRSDDRLHHAVCGLRPGSVFKLVTALATLEAGVSPDDTADCARRGLLPSGRRYVCDAAHGPVDLREAFAESCNCYFETMAERVGPDAMLAACRELGLDASPRLHLPGTAAGLSVTLRGLRVLDGGELRFLSIGQGRASASPLQIAVAYARLASGGRKVTPYLVDDEAPGAFDVEPNLARYAPILKDGARRCVTSGTGAAVAGLAAVDAAGKSGTADTNVVGSSNNAWFAAYAPASNPRFVAVVVYEKVKGHGASTVGGHVARLLAEALK
jgi:cell division protein FtsI/penicillin-binding protein 2